ncbi:unnamed protein product, partial [Closterium sp. NIES-54]
PPFAALSRCVATRPVAPSSGAPLPRPCSRLCSGPLAALPRPLPRPRPLSRTGPGPVTAPSQTGPNPSPALSRPRPFPGPVPDLTRPRPCPDPGPAPTPALPRPYRGSVPALSRPRPGPVPALLRPDPGPAPALPLPCPGSAPALLLHCRGPAPLRPRTICGPAPALPPTCPGPAPTLPRPCPGLAPGKSTAEPGRTAEPRRSAEPRRPAEPPCRAALPCLACLADKDGLSLFDLTSGASTAPAADADSTVRSQWLTRDAAPRLAVRNNLPSTKRPHFSQYKSARALYDAVVARYSSPTTAALSRLMLPYLCLDLAAFATVADLVAHLCTSDARYRAALPTEFLPTNSPPMYITLYYLVTRLPDSLLSQGSLSLPLPHRADCRLARGAPFCS